MDLRVVSNVNHQLHGHVWLQCPSRLKEAHCRVVILLSQQELTTDPRMVRTDSGNPRGQQSHNHGSEVPLPCASPYNTVRPEHWYTWRAASQHGSPEQKVKKDA